MHNFCYVYTYFTYYCGVFFSAARMLVCGWWNDGGSVPQVSEYITLFTENTSGMTFNPLNGGRMESESPNGVRNWILSNAHTSYRPEPDHTWLSSKLRQHTYNVSIYNTTTPYRKPHMEALSEVIRGILLLFQQALRTVPIIYRETQECSLTTQQYSTYKEWVKYNE